MAKNQTDFNLSDREIDDLLMQNVRAAFGADCSLDEALRRIANGDLRGTAIEGDILSLKSLRDA